MILRLTVFLIFSLIQILYSQHSELYSKIKNHYQNFEYREVISTVDELMLYRDSVSKEIYNDAMLMKGVSYYVLSDEPQTRLCFIEILKTDSTFNLDSVNVSPKILTLFNQVKKEYLQSVNFPKENKPKQITEEDLLKYKITSERNKEVRIATLKSVIVPGLGHFGLNENAKGWILTGLSTISASAIIFYIFDTNNKEKDYLGESNEELIRQKYDLYNTSYLMRNISILAYALIWIYTQVDILFFSGEKYINFTNDTNISFNPHKGVILTF